MGNAIGIDDITDLMAETADKFLNKIDQVVEIFVDTTNTTVTRLLSEIDPSILKLQNVMLTVLNTTEEKIVARTSDVVDALTTNLLTWLFLALLFGIVTLLFVYLLAAVMEKCAFTPRARSVASSMSLTVVLIWLFVGITFMCFGSNAGAINFRTLKLICFGLLCVPLVLVIAIWSCYLLSHRALIAPAIKSIFFINSTMPVYPSDTIQEIVRPSRDQARRTNPVYEPELVDHSQL